jgi:hypothetical protein
MQKPKNEAELLAEQPVDKIDKNIRHIFGLLVEKDWKTAKSLAKLMLANDDPAIKQVGNGFDELTDFLKDFGSGKELKAALKYTDSLLLKDELESLLPVLDEEDREKLKADIESKGIVAPLIVQEGPEGLVLVDGYTRYRIAEELGIKRIPVVSVTNLIDSKMLALTLNLSRRHMTKEQRNEVIKNLPIPKVGRPKKGEEVISKKQLAEELGVSEDTIQRARNPKKDANASISKSKKLKRICTPPDSIVPLVPSEDSKTGVIWFTDQHKNMLDKAGYVKGIGYSMDFTKDQVNYDWLVKQTENCMSDLLAAIQKAGLEGVVAKYRMTVQFEARKKEVK